jgi:hypothetical protein
MLSLGIYNLGFLATARSKTTFTFLKWWQNRLQEHCYYRPSSGMFYDQLWLTLGPLYFPGIFVEKNPGCNMSYWNHFERQLTVRNGRYIVNGEHELLFYHFSNYDPEQPDLIERRQQIEVMSFKERPDLKPLFDMYRSRLLARDYLSVRSLKYSLRDGDPKHPSTSPPLKRGVRALLRALPNLAQLSLRRLAHFTINTFE